MILPPGANAVDPFREKGLQLDRVDEGFSYNSGTNPEFLTVDEIRSLIQLHVDPNFRPV